MNDRIRELIQERERYLHCGDMDFVQEIEEELRQLGYAVIEIALPPPNTERAIRPHPTRRQI